MPKTRKTTKSGKPLRKGDDVHGDDSDAAFETSNEMEVDLNDFSPGNLRADLNKILRAELSQNCSFAYAQPHPSVPNPCLEIEGIGGVGLPLSQRDVKAIISVATQAPFGHGKRTVVNPSTRKTWEIDPKKINITNPEWTTFVHKVVVPQVWKELGVAGMSDNVRCELYKLLLYEAGSHFLRHQDTQKAPGMFATVEVTLPSPYTGGQVHVSQDENESIFDLSRTSASVTSVLAWYTDVFHSIKPITSGYRLALSYNLVHTLPSVSRPTTPSLQASLTRLGKILTAWRHGLYPKAPGIVAYMFDHQYNPSELRQGVACLKGQDSYTLPHKRSADHGGCYYKRRRFDFYDDYDGYDDYVGTGTVHDRELTVSMVVNAEGGTTPSGFDESALDEDCFIPEGIFDNDNPDEREYEGYIGSLDYWYHRTALIFVHRANVWIVKYNAKRLTYAVPKLLQANPNAPKEKQRCIYQRACEEPLTAYTTNNWGDMADVTLRWKNFDKWFEVVKRSVDSDIGFPRVVKAVEAFSLVRVLPVVEKMLQNFKSMGDRLQFIQELGKTCSGKHNLVQWSQTQSQEAITSVNLTTTADIPSLINLVNTEGLQPTVNMLVSQLQKAGNVYNAAITFIKQLLIYHKSAAETEKARSNEIITSLLKNQVIPQWNSNAAYGYGYFHSQSDRIAEIVGLCLEAEQNVLVQFLLALMLSPGKDIPARLDSIYIPVVKPLREALTQHQKTIFEQPFAYFFQLVVSLYLNQKLGPKPTSSVIPRKLGCGCLDCQELARFLVESANPTHLFKVVQARRNHLIQRLTTGAGADIVTYEVHKGRSPHALVVRKSPAIFAVTEWNEKQKSANQFLQTICDNGRLQKLMGNRWADVVAALEGTKAFQLNLGLRTSGATQATVAPVARPTMLGHQQGTKRGFPG
ncbi:hypothetical protein AX16_002325 [Volvariella volvacea WC 439]|nr:hypothetical protein AX16_002325 [Volvariella volvacea WC 439]